MWLPATADIAEALLVSTDGKILRFRGADNLELRLHGENPPPKLGTWGRLRYKDGLLIEFKPLPTTMVQGRLHALNVEQQRLRLKTRAGPLSSFEVAPHCVLFKELRTRPLYSLHRGELLIVIHQRDQILAIFDAVSYLVRELTPEYGPLLSWGTVLKVEDAQIVCFDDRTGNKRSIAYNQETRFKLGAVIRSLQDFEGSDSLIFGNGGRATYVLNKRAFPFLLDSLVSDL